MDIESQDQSKTLFSGAKTTSQRIDIHLILGQREPENVEHRFNLASEILTLLSEEDRKEEYKEFNEKFLEYQKNVNEKIQNYNNLPSNHKNFIIGKIINLNYNFDIVCRITLQKFDYLMVGKKSFSNIFLDEEEILE